MNKTAATIIMLVFAVTMNIAYAGPLGTNITVFDNNGSSSAGEDNETEPGTIHSQVWDLEAFFLNGNTLSMVGGYNFRDGVTYSGKTYTTGDIFIDIDGNAIYGTTPITSFTGFNQYGWDYAIRMNFLASTYEVYWINSSTIVRAVTDIPSSNPWKLELAVTNPPLPIIPTGNFTFDSVTPTGMASWNGNDTHYTVSGFDLGFLGNAKDFTVHYTIECGNDNLIGHGTTAVPEPGTLVLLGLGICGLAGFKRFSHKK